MCTGIRLRAANGNVVFARTMEFDAPVMTTLSYVPRGHKWTGETATGFDGIEWVSKYALAGQALVERCFCTDGINEEGLAAGIFNLAVYTRFTPLTDQNRSSALSAWQMVAFVLANYATVAEAKASIGGDFVVVDTPFPFQSTKPGQLPLHMRVGDATGAAIVVEWTEPGAPPRIHDAPSGIITNAPLYDWHVTNEELYDHLSPYNPSGPFHEGSQDYKNTMGNGYSGLPGGSSSSDRFVRASVYSRDAYEVATGADAVWQAWHIMNNFDLPPGILRNVDGDTGKERSEYTRWTSVADTKNLCYYFRSQDNNNIYKIDMTTLDPNNSEVLQDDSPGVAANATRAVFAS